MYHTTTWENAQEILQKGLQPKERGFGGFTTEYGDMEIGKYYRGFGRPAFLGAKPWNTTGDYDTILKVDVSGIPLAADIPSVVEQTGTEYGVILVKQKQFVGSSYDKEKGRHVDQYRTNGPVWQALGPFVTDSDGHVPFEILATPGHSAAKAAVKLTGTAAVYDTISPDRISMHKTTHDSSNDPTSPQPKGEIEGMKRIGNSYEDGKGVWQQKWNAEKKKWEMKLIYEF